MTAFPMGHRTPYFGDHSTMKRLFICMVCWIGLLPHPAATQLVFGPDDKSEANNLDSIVAVVDDDLISRSELDAAMATIERQLQKKGTTLPPRNVIENQVLERLILTKLQVRAAERNGIVVDDQTLNAAIANIARQNNLTLAQLREAIERDGFDFNAFRNQIRQEIMATRLRQRVVDSQIQISDQEVDNYLKNAKVGAQNNEYHIAQILVALPEGASPEQIEASRSKVLQILSELRQGADFKRVAVSSSDDRQALEGGDLGWRRLDQMPSLFAEVIPHLQVGDVSNPIRSPRGYHLIKLLEVRGSQQQTVQQTHVRHILIAASERVPDEDAQMRLQRMYERIENGADFAELARANSNDAASAVKGGDLGWLGPGDLPPTFQQEIDKLQDGELSQPFKSPLGWHLAQVLERRQSNVSDKILRAQVREALFKRREEEEWESWLRRMRDEAYVEIRLDRSVANGKN